MEYIRSIIKSVNMRSPYAAITLFVLAVTSYVLMGSLAQTVFDIPVESASFPNQQDGGSLRAELFVLGEDSANPLPDTVPSKKLLWGALDSIAHIQSSDIKGLVLIVMVFIFVSALVLNRTKHVLARYVFLSSVIAVSLVLALRVGEGWDEFFINLKHSYNLAHHFLYSANVDSRIEATVDLIPFAAAGLIALLTPLNAADAALMIGLSGSVIVIIVGYLFVRGVSSGNELPAITTSILLAIFPPIVYVSGTGFMSVLFTGMILLAGYWLIVLKGKWTNRAVILLGLLCLFRIEGVILAIFVWLGMTLSFIVTSVGVNARRVYIFKGTRILAKRLAIILVPFISISLIRLITFGHAIPLPVTFKNANGDFHYLKAGMLYFHNLVSYFQFDILVALTGILVIMFVLNLGRRALIFTISVVLFSMVYLTGAGDWFPDYWARYLAPMLTLLLILIVASVFWFARKAGPRMGGIYFIILMIMAGFLIGTHGEDENAYKRLSADAKREYNRWLRIDRLAAFGNYLRKTTPDDAVISSPEMAAIMYFARRDLLDLLGIANEDIATAELDPLYKADRVHRKRNIETLAKHRPEIIALWEMSFYLDSDFDLSDNLLIQERVQSAALDQKKLDVSFYRAGSSLYLQSLGYQPLVVAMKNTLFYYWAHNSIRDHHLEKIEALGFEKRGKIELSYQYSDGVASRFYGGIPIEK